MAENNNRRFAIFIAALSALFTFLVYIPSLGNGFVNWDDPSLIYKNPRFGHLDIIWALTARAVGNWHPATILSLELDRLLWGFDPFGYHLTNVILHSLNSFLAGALSGGWPPRRRRLFFSARLLPALPYGRSRQRARSNRSTPCP